MSFSDCIRKFPRPARPGPAVRVAGSDADDDTVAMIEALVTPDDRPPYDPGAWGVCVVIRLAESGDGALGYCASEPHGRVRRLHRVAVLSGARRRGVGKALVAHAQRSVEASGRRCRGLDAVLDETDLAGQLFLRACGSRAESHSDRDPDGPRVVGGLVRLKWVCPVLLTECGGVW